MLEIGLRTLLLFWISIRLVLVIPFPSLFVNVAIACMYSLRNIYFVSVSFVVYALADTVVTATPHAYHNRLVVTE